MKSARLFLCLVALALLFVFSPSARADSGQFTFTLSSSAQALNCASTNRYVSSVHVRVVPGGTGKVYIGQSSMVTSTLVGVAAILYPNSGAHSEEFPLAFGNDAIDLCDLNVIGDVPGETVLVSFTDLNNSYASTPAHLKLTTARPLVGTTEFDSAYSTADATHGSSSIFRFQVIPGESGKIAIRDISTGGDFVVLYPNSGTLSEHSAWSEQWTKYDPTENNQMSNTDYTAFPDVSGETPLVALWVKLDSSGNKVHPPTSWPNMKITGGSSIVGTTPTQFTTTFTGALAVRFQVEPGVCSKLRIGNSALDLSENGTYKVLWPNCSGGWSETFTLGDASDQLHRIDPRNIYVAADSANTVFRWTLHRDFTATSSATPALAKIVFGATPVAIGSGMAASVKISVTPGQTGKVYIGNASMNTSTLAGLYQVLEPNSVGRMSEEFNLVDPLGDGIDTSAIYVTGDVSGEYALISTLVKGVTPSTNLVEAFSGAVSPSSSVTGTLVTATSLPIAALSIETVPGQAGKMHIGTAGMTSGSPTTSFADQHKVLWPNTGSYNVGEGWTETFVSNCQDGSNCENLSNFSFFPEVSGEQIIVSAWKRQ